MPIIHAHNTSGRVVLVPYKKLCFLPCHRAAGCMLIYGDRLIVAPPGRSPWLLPVDRGCCCAALYSAYAHTRQTDRGGLGTEGEILDYDLISWFKDSMNDNVYFTIY